MNHRMTTLFGSLALAVLAAPAHAQAGDQADLEQRLADAQRRLEQAAREVAELSAEAGGSAGMHRFELLLPSARRAMLGVNLGGAEPGGGGVRVEGVSPGGPAAEAGVRAGDVIVAIEAKPVATGRDLVRAMQAIEPGQKVALELRRAGKPVKLTVEARPLDRMLFAGPEAVPALPAVPPLPPLPPLHGLEFSGDSHWLLQDWGDAEFVTLTPGLGRYFGADKGVLVASAPQDQALGLQDGDVIVAIGGREPENARHAMRILRSYQSGEAVELRILRDRRAQTLQARIPERSAEVVRRHRDVLRDRRPPAAPPAPAG